MTLIFKTAVHNCARCGGYHSSLTFKQFRRPIQDTDGTMWGFWTICPATYEPILLVSHREKEDRVQYSLPDNRRFPDNLELDENGDPVGPLYPGDSFELQLDHPPTAGEDYRKRIDPDIRNDDVDEDGLPFDRLVWDPIMQWYTHPNRLVKQPLTSSFEETGLGKEIMTGLDKLFSEKDDSNE
jgi:hypothetical protein